MGTFWIVLFSGRTFISQEFVVICRICNFVTFIGIVSTSTDDSGLRLVQIFAENDILTEIGLIYLWICCSFSCLETFWIVLFSGRTLVYAYDFRVI